MVRIIVVLGVTGIQGGSVADVFLKKPGWSVRGVTRSASSAAAKDLAAKGVDIVEADLDVPPSFDGIFRGASAIFAVTDFWQPFHQMYPTLKNVDRATGEFAFNKEVARAKVFVDAAAKVLEEERKLEILVWSALPPVKKPSGGKYTYVYHFDSKAAVTDYIHDTYPELWAKTSLLNMGFYTNNLIRMRVVYSVVKEADGSYTFLQPGSKDALHPMIDPYDAGVVTDVLINSAPGKNVLACGEMMSWATFVSLWSELLGVRAQVKELPDTARDEVLPGGFGREACESMSWSAEFGWGKDLILPWEIDPSVKLKLTSMKEYILKENWDVILGK